MLPFGKSLVNFLRLTVRSQVEFWLTRQSNGWFLSCIFAIPLRFILWQKCNLKTTVYRGVRVIQGIAMSREKFFEEVKANFPKISESADKEYFRLWGDFKSDLYSYSWFESLANALNLEMNRGVSPKEHQSLFLFIGNGFQSGNEEVKQAIDVAFVENLFWNVSSNYIEPYWNILPEVLQELYFNFHGRKPFKI